MMPYGDIDLVSDVLWYSPVENSQKILMTNDMRLKMTNLRLQPHLPGVNKLGIW